MRFLFQKIVLAALFFSGCQKQENSPAPQTNQFIQFTKRNSPLPDDQVNAVSVAGGTVWIGTQNGLARLSNGSWTVFTPANSDLPSSVILSVAAVSNNCVWIGTDNGLLNYCGGKWTHYTTSNSLLKNNVVKEIAVDPQRNIVWAGTEGGLFRLSENSQEWFDDTNSGLMENLVTALAVASNGNVVVGTFDPFQFQGSCWQYNGSQWTRIRLNSIGHASSFVNYLFVNGNKWWLGIGGTSGGAAISMTDGQPVIKHDRQTSPIVGGVSVVAEEEDVLWVASGAGLYQLANAQWKHFTSKNSRLPDDHILCMQAANGKLYLGTLQGGLVEFQP